MERSNCRRSNKHENKELNRIMAKQRQNKGQPRTFRRLNKEMLNRDADFHREQKCLRLSHE